MNRGSNSPRVARLRETPRDKIGDQLPPVVGAFTLTFR